MKNPITKLAVWGIKFEGGIEFHIVHNLPEKTFDTLFDRWYNMPLPFEEDSLILFVKIHYPDCICVKKSDYDKITKGKVERATKEEYEAQNHGL
jgi:hypothetical protein